MTQREHIITEAATMFLDEGIKAVRMDDIADKLGISKRTLYELFGDKKELLKECLTHYFEQKRQAFIDSSTGAGNVYEQLFMMLACIRRDEKNDALVSSLKRFYPDIHHSLFSAGHKFASEEFGKILDRGIKEELFVSDLNKDLTLYTLITLAEFFNSRYHQQKIGDEAVRYALFNFFRGLATHKGLEVLDALVKNNRGILKT